jgi:hypothetical protein
MADNCCVCKLSGGNITTQKGSFPLLAVTERIPEGKQDFASRFPHESSYDDNPMFVSFRAGRRPVQYDW